MTDETLETKIAAVLSDKGWAPQREAARNMATQIVALCRGAIADELLAEGRGLDTGAMSVSHAAEIARGF